jgi:hypothetical protein
MVRHLRSSPLPNRGWLPSVVDTNNFGWPEQPRSVEKTPAASQQWAIPFPTGITFWLLSLAGLVLPLIRINSRPAGDYNWEAYTVAGLLDFGRRPSTSILSINGGLMTDSGHSAVTVGPMWLTTTLFGTTFGSMRVAAVLLAGFAIPLVWLLGRELASDAVGLGAAILVGTSQVYLLYERTATNVGLSLTPALIGFLLLWRLVRPNGGRWWIPLVLFQVGLVADGYFYSPIRFLWPIACVLFLVESILRSGDRLRFLTCFLATIAILPLAIGLMMDGHRIQAVEAVENYYYGRGEQVFTFSNNPAEFVPFLHPASDSEREQLATESNGALTRRLIRINAKALGNLLVDRQTRPAITDYWNPHGRLYTVWLVPLFILAQVIFLWRFFRDPRARYLLALFWGFSLPLLLTSNVHIGRLIFVVPVLGVSCVLAGDIGVRWIGRRLLKARAAGFQLVLPLVVCLVIGIVGAVASLQDWFGTAFEPERAEVVAAKASRIMNAKPSVQLAYVFGDDSGWEIEHLRISVLEIDMAGSVRFIDVVDGESFGSGPVPLLFHGMLDRLKDPATVPGYCTNLYLLEPDAADSFRRITNPSAQAVCGRPLDYQVV